MTPKKPSPKAVKAVEKIVRDLTDRRGLKQEWWEIDEDLQEEIKTIWALAIDSVFRSP